MLRTGDHDRESQILIRELNHRVYNEFQVMANLLAKCTRDPSTESSAQILHDMEYRIFAFADLNRLLAKPDPSLSLGELCRSACEYLLKAFARPDVVLRLDVDDLPLTERELTYLSLALVELALNALKHSLAADVAGVLSVELKAEHGGAVLRVSDNTLATSFCEAVSLPQTVHALAGCLGGEVVVTRRSGYAVSLRFPLENADTRLQCAAKWVA